MILYVSLKCIISVECLFTSVTGEKVILFMMIFTCLWRFFFAKIFLKVSQGNQFFAFSVEGFPFFRLALLLKDLLQSLQFSKLVNGWITQQCTVNKNTVMQFLMSDKIYVVFHRFVADITDVVLPSVYMQLQVPLTAEY